MTNSQCRRVKLGTRVHWENDKQDQGVVVDKDTKSGSLFIRWDDGYKYWLDTSLNKKLRLVK